MCPILRASLGGMISLITFEALPFSVALKSADRGKCFRWTMNEEAAWLLLVIKVLSHFGPPYKMKPWVMTSVHAICPQERPSDLFIEVKASERMPFVFFLTENEWKFAQTVRDSYVFHFWHLPTRIHRVVSVDSFTACPNKPRVWHLEENPDSLAGDIRPTPDVKAHLCTACGLFKTLTACNPPRSVNA